MKIFLLFMTVLYIISIISSIYKIPKRETLKDSLDKMMEKNKCYSKSDKEVCVLSLWILSIPTILYIILSMNFVGTFWFTVVGAMFILWSVYDLSTSSDYISNDIIISPTLDNKLYRILSLPFDIAFAVFIFYQLFTRW